MRGCDGCGAENPDENRFCGDCGQPLAAICQACEAPTEPGRRFCGQCGAPLGAPLNPAGAAGPATPAGAASAPGRTSAPATHAPQRPPNAPLAAPARPGATAAAATTSERRVCSILFADLVGFTPLSEARDPEEVRALLSRYFDVTSTIITRYGGIVEKFIGDAVMAVWGTPVASELDPERAVRAALDVVEAVHVLGKEVGAEDLSARGGVVTGEVAVTLGASWEGMVAGDAVNTASRVQSVARPGTVFVDEATRRLAGRAISFEDEGAHELKGKELPEHLHRAVRVLSGIGGSQRADGLEAPLTGRDGELRTLKELFHASIGRRSPYLVVVSGPAGVGKSRLGWEFEKYIDGLAETMLWHRGRCLSYGEGVSFWALAEIVRRRFGISEEESTGAASAKLAEGLVRFVSDEGERDYVGVRIASLLGVEYASAERTVLSKEELFAGWRLFFERLAAVAPVVMLVEDAQHADESLLGFFEHLIDWTRDLPIFVLLFARPGLAAIDSGYGVGRNRSTLSLDPLADASMSGLVEALVPGMPSEARDSITMRAQGIPLFAVETIRSLIDRGIVSGHAGSYRLVGAIGELSVPESLHALLAARLDILSPEVRALVADASVLGSSFSTEAVAAVSGMDGAAISSGLVELVRRDVLEVSADPLSPERGSYRFEQEMLRQVAYETLSRADRKVRHLAVASHLRTTFANDGEEIADAIARHYLDALAAGPDEADAAEVKREALAFLVRAAERAERSGALGRAAVAFSEAAEIAPAREAARLHERAATARTEHGDYVGALSSADAAKEIYLELGDERGAARARMRKGETLARTGQRTAAGVELHEALRVLREEPDADTVEALGRAAAFEALAGNTVEGSGLADEAIALGQALDVDARVLASLFVAKGIAAARDNRMIEAAMHQESAARLAEESGALDVLTRAQLNLSDALLRTRPRRALEPARSSAEHARRTGHRRTLAIAITNLAVAHLELGEWDEAEILLTEALVGEHLDEDTLRATRGWLEGLRGETASAAATLEVCAAYRRSEDPQDKVSIGVLDALLALCEGDPGGALGHAKDVLALGDEVGLGSDSQRWAFPLAARAARSLGDSASLTELLQMIDVPPDGHLPPVLRAERKLVHALVDADAATSIPSPADTVLASSVALVAALPAVAAAVDALREVGNPYQHAHGLVDYAEVLGRAGRTEDASAALTEAAEIAARLRCPPLAERCELVAGSLRRKELDPA